MPESYFLHVFMHKCSVQELQMTEQKYWKIQQKCMMLKFPTPSMNKKKKMAYE